MLRMFSIVALLVFAPLGAGAEEAELKLLSWNNRVDFDGSSWPQREATVRQILTAEPYSVIALQEASEIMIASYQAMLPDHHYIVGERSDGHRGDQGWYEYNPIFYDPDVWQRKDTGSFWVGEDPDKPGDTLVNSKDHGRVFTWVVLKHVDSGAEVAIGNVHTHGQQAHRAVDLILDRLRSTVGRIPVILAGDFNAIPETDAYRRLITSHGLVDTWTASPQRAGPAVTVIGEGEAVPSSADGFKQGRNARRIDYVFADPMISILAHEVITMSITPGVFPSDHFPLAVRLSVPPLAEDRIGQLRSAFGRPGGDVMVTAHRGCWENAPENSIAAIEACIALGVDVIELDVRRTADGVLVLMHDETLERTTSGGGLLSDTPFAALRSLILRGGAGGDGARPTTQLIPTLAEALSTARGHMLINLDFKEPGLYAEGLAIAKATGTRDHILFKSAAPGADVRAQVGATLDEVLYMPIVGEAVGALQSQLDRYQDLNPVAYEVLFTDTAYLLDAPTDLRIWVNTLNEDHAAGIQDPAALIDPDGTWGQLVRLGADVIQTDEPAALLGYLEQNGWR